MYGVGQYVVCKSGGIWQVKEVQGSTRLLKNLQSRETRKVSLESGEIVRGVIGKDALLEVIGRVPYIRTVQAPNDRIRRDFYEEAMAQFDEIEWIKVIKSVYLRGEEKPLSPAEKEYGERAKAYFHGEISACLGLPMDQVEAYIASSVSEDQW